MSATLDLTRLKPGFRDPIRDSQSTFRCIMDAMSAPGMIVTLPQAGEAPNAVGSAAGAVLLALADIDTPVWLGPPLADADLATWLRFHCNCPLTADPLEAAFALTVGGEAPPALADFNAGDARYPDRATTVIIVLPSLTSGPKVSLQGPGVQSATAIAPAGLRDGFWAERTALTSKFQFGVDLMFCSGDSLICLPRTTRTQQEEG